MRGEIHCRYVEVCAGEDWHVQEMGEKDCCGRSVVRGACEIR